MVFDQLKAGEALGNDAFDIANGTCSLQMSCGCLVSAAAVDGVVVLKGGNLSGREAGIVQLFLHEVHGVVGTGIVGHIIEDDFVILGAHVLACLLVVLYRDDQPLVKGVGHHVGIGTESLGDNGLRGGFGLAVHLLTGHLVDVAHGVLDVGGLHVIEGVHVVHGILLVLLVLQGDGVRGNGREISLVVGIEELIVGRARLGLEGSRGARIGKSRAGIGNLHVAVVHQHVINAVGLGRMAAPVGKHVDVAVDGHGQR